MVAAVTAALIVSGSASFGAATASASEQDDVVMVTLSADPTESVDQSGRAVKLLEVIGDSDDSAEQVALVATGGGDAAVITTQWRAERSPIDDPIPGGYPTSSEGETTTLPDGTVSTTQGYNFEDLAQLSRKDMEIAFSSAVTRNSVSLKWADVDGARQYTVKRDGVVVAQTSNPEFLDDHLHPGTDFLYEITAEVPVGRGEPAYTSSRTVPLSTLPLNADESGDLTLEPLTYQPYTTAFIYKTFIVNQYVPVGVMETAGCTFPGGVAYGDYFGGDNRGFANPGLAAPWDGPSFRTQAFMNVNWDNPSPYDLVSAKQVGASKLYDSSYVLKSTQTASTSGIVFQNPSHSGNYVAFGLSHEVGNPFCLPGGAIRYSLPWVEIYRGGTVSIEGSRQPVPAHEAYARFSNSFGTETWWSLYTGAQGDFACLMPVICMSENISASRTV